MPYTLWGNSLDIFNLLLFVILIIFTAFFVATEFAIVKVRSSRIDQLVAEGKPGAVAAKRVITHLDEYLSACQLGITVTALGLGWIGEPTIASLFKPLFNRLELTESVMHGVSFVIAFIIVTFLHVVIGELAPKTIAIQKAEAVTLLFAKPIIYFYKMLFPFIWLLNGSARVLTGWFGLHPASESELAHSEEELRILLSESYKSGEINQNELKYVNNIFEFDERLAKEIMVPRTQIITLAQDSTFKEIMEIFVKEKYTRYPVVNGDKDNIVGIINMKEVLTALIKRGTGLDDIPLEGFINPAIMVIETIPIHDLLRIMQKENNHLAILIDEYGGTSGLVTVEDIIEEIVGEIRDEFDADEIADIRKVKENHYVFSAMVLVSEVNDLLGIDLSEDDIDTLGGWFLSHNIEVKLGDQLEDQGYRFIIKESDGHHISFIEVIKL